MANAVFLWSFPFLHCCHTTADIRGPVFSRVLDVAKLILHFTLDAHRSCVLALYLLAVQTQDDFMAHYVFTHPALTCHSSTEF